jgi:hypothetical protein
VWSKEEEKVLDGEGPKVFFLNVLKYFFERKNVKFDSKLKKVRMYIVRKVPARAKRARAEEKISPFEVYACAHSSECSFE